VLQVKTETISEIQAGFLESKIYEQKKKDGYSHSCIINSKYLCDQASKTIQQ